MVNKYCSLTCILSVNCCYQYSCYFGIINSIKMEITKINKNIEFKRFGNECVVINKIIRICPPSNQVTLLVFPPKKNSTLLIITVILGPLVIRIFLFGKNLI